MFASKTLVEHGARGLIGFGGIVAAVIVGRQPGGVALAASLALAVFSLVAFRGCPVCWTIGAAETIRHRLKANQRDQG